MRDLSERLEAIAQLIIPDQPVADIGSDHGNLAMYLLEQQRSPRVIVSEYTDGPYLRLLKETADHPARDRLEVRQGNGLQVLEPCEVATVVIAGMGGDTTVEILSHDWSKTSSFKRLLLQPMTRAGIVRKVLADKGFVINEEKLVQEKHRFYVIICAQPGDTPYQLSAAQEELGPVILSNLPHDPKIKIYLIQALQKYLRLYNSIQKCQSSDNNEQLFRLKQIIQQLEVLTSDSHS